MERYRSRGEALGRSIGLRAITVREVPDAQGPQRVAKEGDALLAVRLKGPLILLDGTGDRLTSPQFAALIQQWLDGGVADVSFAIGGADGHGDTIRSAADRTISLGAMTLPHLLARVILLEQLYRAVTICAGHPYHRS